MLGTVRIVAAVGLLVVLALKISDLVSDEKQTSNFKLLGAGVFFGLVLLVCWFVAPSQNSPNSSTNTLPEAPPPPSPPPSRSVEIRSPEASSVWQKAKKEHREVLDEYERNHRAEHHEH